MRRLVVILLVAGTAAAVVAALRRRAEPSSADERRPAPREQPVRPAVGGDVEPEAPPTRFVELAADEQTRRHEAAERLKADLAG